MQSRDESKNLVSTEILENFPQLTLQDQIRVLLEKMEKANAKGAVSHVVAPLPKESSTVEIMGLTYVVKKSFPGRGRLILELEKPKQGGVE